MSTDHASSWDVGSSRIDLAHPRVMGILNVTPDSFYDGGRFDSPDRAVARAENMVAEGADIIDVGGESSRPAGPYGKGAQTVSTEEEISRTAPLIARIVRLLDVPISIDTTKTAVARAAVEAGATIVNDISGVTQNPDTTRLLAEAKCGVVLMHMKGTPQSMQDNPTYDDVVSEVSSELGKAAVRCTDSGVDAGRIVVDPGFGFGKTRAHNLEILRRLRDFSELGFPLLVGPSRKTFVDPNAAPEDRLAGSLAAASLSVAHGARIVRVHDVAETVRAVNLVQACLPSR